MSIPGYAGQLLRVDLSEGLISKEPLPERLVRDYIGGRGFCARLLWEEVPQGADPLGPDNRVVVASGPLAGIFMPAGGKVEMAAKSPATGGYGDSNMGGHLAAEMKYAGYDVIVFQGKAASPVFLYVDDERAELRDASDLWGQGALTAEKLLKDRLGRDFQIATIAAGEKQWSSCVSTTSAKAGRTALARTGSKNVKASLCVAVGASPLSTCRKSGASAGRCTGSARRRPRSRSGRTWARPR